MASKMSAESLYRNALTGWGMGACLQYLLVYHEGWIEGGSAQDALPRSQKNIFRHVLRLGRSPAVKPSAAGIGRTFAGLEPTRKKPGSILGVGMEGPAAFGVGRLSSMASGPTVRTPRGFPWPQGMPWIQDHTWSILPYAGPTQHPRLGGQ